MIAMEESKYTQAVFDSYSRQFPQGWIEGLSWEPKEEGLSLSKGVKSIREFEICIFVNYSKLILSADYFIHSTVSISQLDSATVTDEILIEGSDYKKGLQEGFVNLCDEIRVFNKILKYHINATENQFKPHAKGTIINALTDTFDGLSSLFKLICDSCWLEFVFAYNEDYIRQLIINLEHLKFVSSKQSGEIKEIIEATIEKILILLGKLSAFSENKELAYRFDLQDYRISLTSLSKLGQDDFRFHFMTVILNHNSCFGSHRGNALPRCEPFL